MVIYAMAEDDTICAVSTPAGEGGIGIIRVSGKRAIDIADAIVRMKSGHRIRGAESHTINYGWIVDPATGETVDEVLVSILRGPGTYTREDVVEINCHGGMLPLGKTMRLLIAAGARQAESGEFTKRAFLNGRIDLAQAEAVMEVIRARTEMSHQAAAEQLMGGLSREVAGLREKLIGIVAGVEAGVDFPEEDIETPSGRGLEEEIRAAMGRIKELLENGFYGRIVREGFAAAIIGRPNVGKSSLLNALLRQDRAIVTDVPGTTRDVLEEWINVNGMPLRVLDTAGIRHSHDIAEQEGVKRSLDAVTRADVVLVVLDGSAPLESEDGRVLDAAQGREAIAVINKSDLPRELEEIAWPERQVAVSCRTRSGLENLRRALTEVIWKGAAPPRAHAWAVNQRHQLALERAQASLERSLESVHNGLSPEFIALDLRDALDSVGMVIGATYTEDILARIFDEFCIGK